MNIEQLKTMKEQLTSCVQNQFNNLNDVNTK